MADILTFNQILQKMKDYYDMEFIDSNTVKCTKSWFGVDPHFVPHRFFICGTKIELQSLSDEPYVKDKENVTMDYLEKCIESAFKTGKLPQEATDENNK